MGKKICSACYMECPELIPYVNIDDLLAFVDDCDSFYEEARKDGTEKSSHKYSQAETALMHICHTFNIRYERIRALNRANNRFLKKSNWERYPDFSGNLYGRALRYLLRDGEELNREMHMQSTHDMIERWVRRSRTKRMTKVIAEFEEMKRIGKTAWMMKKYSDTGESI